MTEEQLEYLENLSYWFEQLTGTTLEQEAERLEVTVDYFIAEFL